MMTKNKRLVFFGTDRRMGTIVTCGSVSLGLLLSRPLLELHLAEMQHCRCTLVQTNLLLVFKAEYDERVLNTVNKRRCHMQTHPDSADLCRRS